MKTRLILPVIAAFLFISCAGNTKQFVVEEYRDMRTFSSVSILTIDLEQLYDEFPSHNFGALRPAEQSIFENQLVSVFRSQTRANVNGLIDSTIYSKTEFQLNRYPIKNDTLTIVSPVQGATLTTSNRAPGFVVILDQFSFNPVEVEGGGSSYAGHETSKETYMVFQTSYLIWDNSSGKAVAWGQVQSDQLMYPTQNRVAMYSDLLSEAFNQIVKKSPFVPVQLAS